MPKDKKNKDKKNLPMEDVQKISLAILKFIANICEREGFRYCLMYGTLIGAIRHKGFIPWDDDVDIMMPRPDYEKFLRYAYSHKDEFAPYEIFNREVNSEYIYSITRVSDSRYIIDKEDEKNCGMGIFIDIYPYDGLGDDKANALKILARTNYLCNKIIDITRTNIKIPKTLNLKGKITFWLGLRFSSLRGVDHYINKLNKNKKNFTFDSSTYVGPAMWFFTRPEKVLFERSLFDNLIKVPFEDGEFFVPADYDKLLTQEYGDYMKLPPVEKRIYHHQYKAYKKD